MAAKQTQLTVNGHSVRLTNPDKMMFPDANFTKTDLVDYYRKIAPVILPHLESRALTRIRYPNGAGASRFYEKNAPDGTPDWVHTELVDSPGSSKGRDQVNYVVATDTATLAWLGNLAALELHTPQWRFDNPHPDRRPDRLVADLDPGEPAGIAECAEVAVLLRDRLAADGLTAYPKTSGKKGVHVCCPVSGNQHYQLLSDYMKRVARELESSHGHLVTSKMPKDLRHGKVFIDWSQNNAAKTTVAVYSLRARSHPTVSAPVTWDEVESGAPPILTPDEVFDRLDSDGDGYAPLLRAGPEVPTE